MVSGLLAALSALATECGGKSCTEELFCVSSQEEADRRNADSDCGGYAYCPVPPVADASVEHHDATTIDSAPPHDASTEEADVRDCHDVLIFEPDGGNCIVVGCPYGSACIEEIGGPHFAPQGLCVTISASCTGATDCSCVAACACPGEACSWGSGGELLCDDGVR